MTESIHVLIIDDDPEVCEVLSNVLSEEGYLTSVAESGARGIESTRKHFYNAALVDMKLPDMNGLQVLQEVREIHPEMSVIMITTHRAAKNAVEALKKGADAYVTKPLNLDEVTVIVKKEVRNQGLLLEKTRQEQELREDFMATIETLAALIEVKDPYLAGHSKDVKKWSCLIAKKIGLSEKGIKDIEIAAVLHDIGKIGVKGKILDTQGGLTLTEFQEVKLHPLLGESAIKHIRELRNASMIIRHHHEYWDGQGYPDGLKEKEIPIGSRIVSVADAFNAMTSNRPYRRALSDEKAVSRLVIDKGKQFDPAVVDAFADCLRETVERRHKR